MRTFLLFLANLYSRMTPQTRCFRSRARLFGWAGMEIGTGSKLNGRVIIQYPNVSIGERTWVGARTEFVSTPAAAIKIGSDCDISQDVYFIVGSHDIGTPGRRAGTGTSRPICVGAGTWVGVRATFLSGSSVGQGCVVAAGSLVRDEFGDNVLIAGSPARVIKPLEK